MKKIYIVLTYTGTFLSKIIRGYTKHEFAHVSIALDSKLEQMYSFGRLNPYIFFWGGFVHEGVNRGTFKRFKKTKTKIYSIDVYNEQYNLIKNVIYDIKTNRKKYSFNMAGMFLTALNIRRKKEYSFYCAEFVKHCLDESNIKTSLPDTVKPEDFKLIENKKLVFNGLLREYDAV